MPGPIIFGLVFDVACLVWQETCDGGEGSCWIYDTQFLAEGIFWACIVVKGVSTLGFLMAYCLYRPPAEDAEEKIAHEIDVNVNEKSEVKCVIDANEQSDVKGVINGGYEYYVSEKGQMTYL